MTDGKSQTTERTWQRLVDTISLAIQEVDDPGRAYAAQRALNEIIDQRGTQVERLRLFAQWVADHSNDPAVVQEAKRHGAESPLRPEQNTDS